MIRFMPELQDMPTFGLCLLIVAAVVAIIAEYFWGARK